MKTLKLHTNTCKGAIRTSSCDHCSILTGTFVKHYIIFTAGSKSTDARILCAFIDRWFKRRTKIFQFTHSVGNIHVDVCMFSNQPNLCIGYAGFTTVALSKSYNLITYCKSSVVVMHTMKFEYEPTPAT